MMLQEKASQLMNDARAIPRLNVPAYNRWSEALHGVIDDGVTEFPELIGLAATFDVPAIHAIAIDVGIEGRIKHLQDVQAGHDGIMAWAG
jgi:beta-glucosidase